MDLNLRQLRMLREVSERGTISAAADALGYTPSAVSQQLGSLEKSTGVAVLERVGRNVRLTDAGRELVGHADELLGKLEEAQAALERVGTQPLGHVEMSIFESVATRLVPAALARLAASDPDLRVSTRQIDPDLALDALAIGDLDLAFVIDYPNAPGPQPDGIDRCLVCHDWFRAVLPVDDPIAEGPVHVSDLADRAFVASPPGLSCGRFFVQTARNAGFEPRIAHQIDDFAASLRLVEAGAGVALLPDLGLLDVPAGVRVADLAVPQCRTIQLAYRTTSAERPGLRRVCDAVVESAADFGLDQRPETNPQPL